MSESWVQECKKILTQIKNIKNIKGKDRLDMVQTIGFLLYALQRSLSGWIEWVENPEVMASFSLEELKEIGKNLSKLTQSFIEYDCEVTSLSQMDLKIRKLETEKTSKKAKDRINRFYVS